MSSESKRNAVIPDSKRTWYSLSSVLPSMLFGNALLIGLYFLYTSVYTNLAILRLPKAGSSQIDRLLFTLKWQLFPVATLALSIWHTMLCRVTNPAARNPLSGHEYFVEVASRILANTLEQTLFFTGNILVFSVIAPERYFYLVPLFVFYFTFGRIAFLIGYSIHPKYRVIGFVSTFVPTNLIFIYNLIMFWA